MEIAGRICHLKRNEYRGSDGFAMTVISDGSESSILQCTWQDAKVLNPFTVETYIIFAKSHQSNAALRLNVKVVPNLANTKEMIRNYVHRSSGKLCVRVDWSNYGLSDGSKEMLKVKNLASSQVQPTPTVKKMRNCTVFQWSHVDAGQLQLTLRWDKRQPKFVDLCPPPKLKASIQRTWTSMPKAIKKCQFNVGESSEFSARPSSVPDPTIKPNWGLEEWAHVCDRLGIGSNDAGVPIKFCNSNGCNFGTCPHPQEKPSYLFEF